MDSFRRMSPSDTEMEKEILTGMITSGKYLKEIVQLYTPETFKIPYGRIIGQWCMDYFKKYSDAPGDVVTELYDVYSNNKRSDESQVELIGKFLNNLSGEYGKNKNIKYYASKAERYFRKRQIEIHRDNLTALLLQDKIEEAETFNASFKRKARSESVGIDIIKGNITPYLYEEDEVLFEFPGALGNMIAKFCREDFVGIAAPMKRGKTFWLQEIGLKGLMRGFNVIFYSFEMSYAKMIKRLYQGFMGVPKKAGEIEIPYFNKDNGIEYKTVMKEAFAPDNALKKKKQLERMFADGQFRLVCSPTGSMNVEDIKRNLDNLDSNDHFVPDIIISDYADIMAPEKESMREERHKLNLTWLSLRGLAQERKCLVVTGTQLVKATFGRDATEQDMAEDVRKLAHVTSMIALNQSKEDKKDKIMRMAALVNRDVEFHLGDEILVLESKDIGRPFLDARWKEDVKNYK